METGILNRSLTSLDATMHRLLIMSCKKKSKKDFQNGMRGSLQPRKEQGKHFPWKRAGCQRRNIEHLRSKKDGRRLMRQATRMTLSSSSNKVLTPSLGVLSYWCVAGTGTINMKVMAKIIYIQCS